MNKISETWRNYKKRREHGEMGLRIRNSIHQLTEIVYPYARIIIPNFKAAHYTYIIFMTFLGSVILYPLRNMKYIDALFFTGCASTQAGLNTIDMNRIALYQQIAIYIIATFTTPIFIHGSLLFIRLYWFERHFDNIKEQSKLNNKMRRSATLAARTQSLDPTVVNTEVNRGIGLTNTQNRRDTMPTDEEAVSPGASNSSSTIAASKNSTPLQDRNANLNSVGVEHMSEPSDSEPEPGRAIDSRNGPNETKRAESPSRSLEGIRFGNLPNPSKIRQKEIEPSDMYMSIAMLQDNHKSEHKDRGDEDDVLIIKSPNEIEKDSHNPIFTKKSQIHFDVNEKPTKNQKKKKRRRRFSRGRQPWSKLKKTLSNSAVSPRKNFQSFSFSLINNEDDDQSIDSENNNKITATDLDDDENALMDDDDDDEDEEDEDEDEEYNDEERDKDENLQDLERAQSNLVIPSSDATGGKKFTKRSNTLDVTPSEKSSFPHSPTFERMIKSKLKMGQSGKNSRKLRYFKSPAIGRASSAVSFNSEDSEYDDSDEEDDSDDAKSLLKVMSTNYLSWQPTVGRNSTFVHLSEDQKEELGGVEYRAIKLLIKIIVIYYIGFHILAFTCLLPYIIYQPGYKKDIKEMKITPTWWAFFTAQSAFNDLGLTLTPNSMESFNESVYVMVIVSFFVVIGNTGFPVMLRFIIWILFKLSKPMTLYNESLGFLLDHPRRCFTLLFPSVPTWWLFFILVVLNAVDLILFIVLDLNNDYLKSIPLGYRIMDGLFQAFSTRTAGFAVIDLSELHPAIQVSYMLMMYISVLPLAISIRRTNVYEEQSLGVYLKDNSEETPDDKTPKNFIGTHLRNQLSFDLWFIFLGLFIICIAEGPKLNKNNYRFSVFTVLFEIISAYGTVGLSLGYPNVNVSLSGEFTTLSKLVMIAMVIRGRHRGLPYALDRAIMLPDDNMQRRDVVQEGHAIRRYQTMETANSNDDGNPFRRAITRRASNFGFENNTFLHRRNTSSIPNKSRSETPNYTVTDESHEMQELA